MLTVVVSCGGVERVQIKYTTNEKKSPTFTGKGLTCIDCHFNLHQTQITQQEITPLISKAD